MKILTIIVLSVIEKIIDPLETRMTNVDPSIVRQHVRPLKNNYVKGCKTFKNCILGPKKDLLGQKKGPDWTTSKIKFLNTEKCLTETANKLLEKFYYIKLI